MGGCLESHEEPRLEVVDVTLETPAGRYQLESTDDPGFLHIDRPDLSFRVRAPSVEVTLAAFAQVPQVMVDPIPQERSVQLEGEGGFYQRDGGPRIPLSGTQPQRGRFGTELNAARLELDLGPPLAGIALVSSKLSRTTIRAIEAIEGERHRFYVPFRIDGERYAFDASFELEVDRSWDVGSIGGMP